MVTKTVKNDVENSAVGVPGRSRIKRWFCLFRKVCGGLVERSGCATHSAISPAINCAGSVPAAANRENKERKREKEKKRK